MAGTNVLRVSWAATHMASATGTRLWSYLQRLSD